MAETEKLGFAISEISSPTERNAMEKIAWFLFTLKRALRVPTAMSHYAVGH